MAGSPKPPKPLSPERYVARHAGVLVEMLSWPNGTLPTVATPGAVMARFIGLGLARREVVDSRIGREIRFHLTEAGERTARTLQRTVGRGARR